MSSTMPSAKYSCSGSPLMFWNGRTASEGLSGQREGRTLGGVEANAENANGLRDVLQLRRAEVVDFKRQLAGGVLAHPRRDADAAGLGQRLKACGDDHAVAEQIVALRHHVALVHADAQVQPVASAAQCVLDRDGAAQRLHGAGEGGQEPVAGGLEHAASVRGRQRLNDIGPQRAHARQRARLVRADHGGIANHVGRQDAGQAASRLAHAHSPIRRTPLGGAYDHGAIQPNRRSPRCAGSKRANGKNPSSCRPASTS